MGCGLSSRHSGEDTAAGQANTNSNYIEMAPRQEKALGLQIVENLPPQVTDTGAAETVEQGPPPIPARNPARLAPRGPAAESGAGSGQENTHAQVPSPATPTTKNPRRIQHHAGPVSDSAGSDANVGRRTTSSPRALSLKRSDSVLRVSNTGVVSNSSSSGYGAQGKDRGYSQPKYKHLAGLSKNVPYPVNGLWGIEGRIAPPTATTRVSASTSSPSSPGQKINTGTNGSSTPTEQDSTSVRIPPPQVLNGSGFSPQRVAVQAAVTVQPAVQPAAAVPSPADVWWASLTEEGKEEVIKARSQMTKEFS